jgi:transcriptional regulator with XRE-family HTH domain
MFSNRHASPVAGASMPGMETAAGPLLVRNRQRQHELYGCPLGDRVRFLTATLGITQARLAAALGISPAMLSQLVSGRRVKIGNPTALARLHLLDRRCAHSSPVDRAEVDALLAEVARTRLQWTAAEPGPSRTRQRPAPSAADVLCTVAPPARLAAAAAALAPAFPELAEVLRRAATSAHGHLHGTGPAPRSHGLRGG